MKPNPYFGCRQINAISPKYLLLTLGPEFGICPYLHPDFGGEVVLSWLNILHRFCETPAPNIVIKIGILYNTLMKNP
ncbi:MAG: hypothetical protein EOO38_15720 [Cytophagaceae bacterium]|nr:MAG: hypothetical protein EOO38_15720 [Cytophagaceae bacterium]